MRVEVAPTRDDRVVAYGVLAAIGIVAGVIGGRPEPMAAAAAFAAAIVIGLRCVDPVAFESSVILPATRCLEGDTIDARIDVVCPPQCSVELGILDTSPGLVPADGTWTWHVDADDIERTVSLRLRIQTASWGQHHLGHLHARATTPGGFVAWETMLARLPTVDVLPRAPRLQQLLAPAATQVSAGAHLARRVTGTGSEFADIRAYQPGDRLRDLNWRATSRRGEPQVNRHHPERAGDVVIVLDTLPDTIRGQSAVGDEVLTAAGRAAWALTRAHLAAQDRVGLFVLGRFMMWLPPAGGRRAQYRLLERLLQARNTEARSGTYVGRDHLRKEIPPSALVLAISSLARDHSLDAVAALRAHGRNVAVLAIDSSNVLSAVEVEPPVARLAELVFDERVARLRRRGIAVVVWRPGDDLDRAIRRLRDLSVRHRRAGTRR
jgi:uncharacterized protein (DUF58 family)